MCVCVCVSRVYVCCIFGGVYVCVCKCRVCVAFLAVCKCHCRCILVQSSLLTVSFFCGFFVFTPGC